MKGETEASFQLEITASVRERPLFATWDLLLLPTWLASSVRESTLLIQLKRAIVFCDKLDLFWYNFMML